MDFQLLLADLDRIIRIESVLDETNPDFLYGQGIQRALEEILLIGQELGFETKNIDNQVGLIEFGQGDETLGILAHIDVVPAGEGWTKPPFKLTIENDILFGRGVLDDKGPIIGILYVLKQLKDEGFIPKKKIQMIIGTDEENLWRGMTYYTKHYDLPDLSFSPDASFPMIFAEKGILDHDLSIDFTDQTIIDGVKLKSFRGGMSRNSVCDQAEMIFQGNPEELLSLKDKIQAIPRDTKDIMTIKDHQFHWLATGVLAHAMQPEKGLNAAMVMIDSLAQISPNESIRLLDDLIGLDCHGHQAGLSLSDNISGKTTLNVGMVHLHDDVLTLKNSIRYCVTADPAAYEELVKKQLKDLNINIIDHLRPLYVPKDSELMKVLSQVYTQVTGDVSQPIAIGGGTYARMLPNAVSFGPCFPDQHECAHEPDEYFEISKFKKMMEIYYAAIVKLTQ